MIDSNETWKPVPGWEGFYEVSDMGQVRSLDRVMTNHRGTQWIKKGRVLKQTLSAGKATKRYRMLYLADGDRRELRYVHQLVLEAFVGPRPDGWVCRHLNDHQDDNRLVNLEYGTYTDNMADQMSNNTHSLAKRTHCANGHEFTPENTHTRTNSSGWTVRHCRRCARDRYHARK